MEPYGGRFVVVAVARTRRECLGGRRTREEAEGEREVYEKHAAPTRNPSKGCKLCG